MLYKATDEPTTNRTQLKNESANNYMVALSAGNYYTYIYSGRPCNYTHPQPGGGGECLIYTIAST
jgi:hypothetical protein